MALPLLVVGLFCVSIQLYLDLRRRSGDSDKFLAWYEVPIGGVSSVVTLFLNTR